VSGRYDGHAYYGCSTVVLICITCPAITVGTVILWALDRVGHLVGSVLDRPTADFKRISVFLIFRPKFELFTLHVQKQRRPTCLLTIKGEPREGLLFDPRVHGPN